MDGTYAAINAEEALQILTCGNAQYVSGNTACDFTANTREKTFTDGQHPYAAVIACSDSRVIPEAIFSAGIGDLFVIRSAGNVIDNVHLGCIQYAAEHLGCKLVLVLGHTKCGALDAAMHSLPQGYVRFITDEALKAIGWETDDFAACKLNVQSGVNKIKNSLKLSGDVCVMGGIYHTDSGKVQFLSD